DTSGLASNDLFDAGLVNPTHFDSSSARLTPPLLQSSEWWYPKHISATWDRLFANPPTAPTAFLEHHHRELYFGTTADRRHASAAMLPNTAFPYSPRLSLWHEGDLSERHPRNPRDKQKGE